MGWGEKQMTQERIGVKEFWKLSTGRAALTLCAALCFPESGLPADAKAMFTVFDPSGSVNTESTSINGNDAIAGFYRDGSDVTHGFVRAAGGTSTEFEPSGSTYPYE